MSKKDIAVTISAADRMLELTKNPLHRQILENYRRHAILEVCGQWEGIFEPEMTVEHPVYYYNVTGFAGYKAEGMEEVQAIYRSLAETQTGVQVVEDERLMVSDWGFASDAIFNTYYRGFNLIDVGVRVEDPDGYFIMRQKYVMLWPYDERGRMIGEQVYENKAFYELIQIPEGDFLTVEDAQARLLPMLRPLPVYEPKTHTAAAR
ncbi:hypothetical protein AB0H69_47115 [Streptomyces phaeochromogenes]|uniref:hypothetical protein n=1 Tax=Streptomyces phaeochromogenes TaxID=1923 RepID=UPI0033D9AF51